jgi:UDP:flavonoid glycosyltransferase YjiC (YdhE family)
VVLAPISLLSRHDPPVLPGLNLLQAARRLGPLAYDLATFLMRSLLRRWEAPVHALRAELGLPATNQLLTLEGQYSPHGTLALFDPVLARPQPDWPAHTTLCGAALHEGVAADAVTTGELQRFLDSGAPPIVFTLGSAAVHVARDYWGEVIAATQRLGRRALLLTGKPIANALPPTIRAFDYLPYSLVFPHAAAVVHQAGIGTLSQALRAGRPQLLVPVGFDQPDNARRATGLGVGRSVPFERITTDRLARELGALLDDPAAAAAARAVAMPLRSLDGASVAAERIVALLQEQAT